MRGWEVQSQPLYAREPVRADADAIPHLGDRLRLGARLIMSQQVTCIRKRDRQNPHERIEGIGGHSPSQWYIPEETAIRNVERDAQSYYTSVGGHSVWVIVATHNGRKYLKTQADSYSPDNLLSLPECPR